MPLTPWRDLKHQPFRPTSRANHLALSERVPSKAESAKIVQITIAEITIRTDMVSQTCNCSGTSARDSELVKSLNVCIVVGLLCPINSIQVVARKLPSGAQHGRGMGWSWTLGDKVYAGVLRILPRGSGYPARLLPVHFAPADYHHHLLWAAD